jgi:hypothetical protein
MQFKLGKRPAVFDSRTLKFGTYEVASLPPPPASVDYGAGINTWPMFGNDQYGDCTCAAAGHMIQDWTFNAGKEVTPTLQDVMTFYEHFVGNPPPQDAGCNMLDVLKYWRSTGLGGNKIDAFVSVEPKNNVQARDAIDLFGALYIGVELPDFAVTGDMITTPWVVPPQGPVGDAAPNPNNGHCIPAVAYDSRNLYIITWGVRKAMSWQFYNAYADEAYAVLSGAFIAKTGKAKNGFDLAALKKDLTIIHGVPSSFATYSKRVHTA